MTDLITKNTGISIAVVLVIVGIAVTATTQTTILRADINRAQDDIKAHVDAPAIHDNINAKLEDKYPTRAELEKEIELINTKLDRIDENQIQIKQDVKEILRVLSR